MQSAFAEETSKRLISLLSGFEQLDNTIISGRNNFDALSQEYLRLILEILDSNAGAILRFDSTKHHLFVESSLNINSESVIIPITSDEIMAMLQPSSLDFSNPPHSLEPFRDRITPQLKALSAKLWIPLQIDKELIGIISLGAFRDGVERRAWRIPPGTPRPSPGSETGCPSPDRLGRRPGASDRGLH